MNNKGRHLGDLIKRKRKELGLTQDQLAFLVVKYHRTAYQYISNCERGISSISPAYFVSLLDALGLDKRELLEAYTLDFIDMVITDVKRQEITQKRKKTIKQKEDKETQERLNAAKEAFKSLGLEF